jgi:hypothetical protein
MNAKENIKYLEHLIDLYFEGLTDTPQETQLRRLLASTELTSDKIDEARAVMGYFAASRTIEGREKRKNAQTRILPRIRLIDIAASVAIIAAFALAVINFRAADDNSRCMAYANDIVISDAAEVMGIMDNDLSAMREATEDFQAEIIDQMESIDINL